LRGERGREGKQGDEKSGNQQPAGDQSLFLRDWFQQIRVSAIAGETGLWIVGQHEVVAKRARLLSCVNDDEPQPHSTQHNRRAPSFRRFFGRKGGRARPSTINSQPITIGGAPRPSHLGTWDTTNPDQPHSTRHNPPCPSFRSPRRPKGWESTKATGTNSCGQSLNARAHGRARGGWRWLREARRSLPGPRSRCARIGSWCG